MAFREPTLDTAQSLRNNPALREDGRPLEPPPPLDNRPPGFEERERPNQSSDSDTSTSQSSHEDFDWFAEEESKSPVEVTAAKRGRWLWLAFLRLARPIRVLFVTLLGSAVLVTPLLVVDLRFRKTVIKTQVHVWSLWFTIIWVTSCLTYLVVDLSPRIFLRLATLCGAKVERLKIEVELIMAAKGWLKLALDIAWAWISLSVLRTIYHPFGSYWTIVNRLMQALFSAGIILFVEKLFLQFVAINFHQKALADRIEENQIGLKALDYLSNAHPGSARSNRKSSPYGKRRHKTTESSEKVNFNVSSNQLDTSPETSNASTPLTGRRPTTPEPTPFRNKNPQPKRRKKKVTDVIVDQVSGAINQVVMKDSRFHKGSDLTGLYSARRLARKLFSNLSNADPPRSVLTVDDFYPYFRTTAEAHEAFKVFDKDDNGDITKKEMREAVQRLYRERKALVSSLKDVSSIVAKLDAVLLCVALVIIIFVTLLIFNRSNTLASLVPLATIILGFSFVFGNSAQKLFESLIFIFSTHVFDVGDLVMIDDQILFVKEFGLFATTFKRVDGQEVIAPNSLLANDKLVHNLRRSKSMWETTTLTVSYNTPLEVLELLKTKIVNYVNSNPREWSGCALNIDKMVFQNAVHLIVAMEHRPNWQDWGGRWTRRTAFMRYLKTVLEELDIRYTMPIQPVILPQGFTELQTPTAPNIGPPPAGRGWSRA